MKNIRIINGKPVVVTDCDGVYLGRMRERTEEHNKLDDYIDLLSAFSALKKQQGYEFIALTDRGGAQLAPLSYVFQASRFQGGESGAVAYDNYAHRIIKNPSFMETIHDVKIIESEFKKEFRHFYPLEPGVYSSIRVERVDDQDMTTPLLYLSEKAKNSSGKLICADHGDCICLKSSKIDKGVGIKWLFSLYENAGIEIDLRNSFWIGDGKADIKAAEFIFNNNGRISAVSNSHVDYRNFIESHGGYLAKKAHTAGKVEIIKHFCGL